MLFRSYRYSNVSAVGGSGSADNLQSPSGIFPYCNHGNDFASCSKKVCSRVLVRSNIPEGGRGISHLLDSPEEATTLSRYLHSQQGLPWTSFGEQNTDVTGRLQYLP